MTSKISKVWAGGEHEFLLGIGELRALEQRSDAGAFVVLTRLLSAQWKIDDVIQPLRLGLIGGGMDEKEAMQLIQRVLSDKASLYSLALPAADILSHFIMWDADSDQPGESEGEKDEANLSPTENPDGPSIT